MPLSFRLCIVTYKWFILLEFFPMTYHWEFCLITYKWFIQLQFTFGYSELEYSLGGITRIIVINVAFTISPRTTCRDVHATMTLCHCIAVHATKLKASYCDIQVVYTTRVFPHDIPLGILSHYIQVVHSITIYIWVFRTWKFHRRKNTHHSYQCRVYNLTKDNISRHTSGLYY